jgi:hypothetical protein
MKITITRCLLKTRLRELWEDHVGWTRNVILCIVDGTPGLEQALNRLLQNQVDIGDTIKPFYGEEGGNELTRLLKEHITIAGDVIDAAKYGNNIEYRNASIKWYNNADEIAVFLAKANPRLKYKDMRRMMKRHLELTTDEVVARVKKDYNADIVAVDNVHKEIRLMSDIIYKAIVKQFPHKFLY